MHAATPPGGTPKYVSVADVLEALIRKGKWDGGRMPSVRGIAEQHNVSVVTAARALQVLRDKGLIQTTERSGSFRVPPPSAERWGLVLRLTPGPWQAATRVLVRGGFEALARRQPMHLVSDPFGLTPDYTAEAAEAEARAAQAAGLQGVFLLPGRTCDAGSRAEEALLAGCRAAGLPVVLMERGLRGHDRCDADLVTVDDLGGGTECTRHLLAGGRTRVGMVVASPTSSHDRRVAGYLFALHAAGAGPPVVVRQPDDGPANAALAALADAVVRERLDGVVCYADYTALGLITELHGRGLRVPRDVAVVGFDDLPLGDSYPAGLTTYAYPAEEMAGHAVRLMREWVKDPTRPPVRLVVPGELIVRGSSAAV